MTEIQYHPDKGDMIGLACQKALAFFQSECVMNQAQNIGAPDTKYFFVFNDIEIVWRPDETVDMLYKQFDAVQAERAKKHERDRLRAQVPDPTALEIHNEAMQEMGKHFRVFTRIGRWGSCGDCPTDGRGDYYPEFCINTHRCFDHDLSLASLVKQYGIKQERATKFLNDQRQAYRDSI